MEQIKESGGRCVSRKFTKPITKELLNDLQCAYNETYCKKYDMNPIHFIQALFGKTFGMNGQSSTAFFCSAFVAYVYTRIGCLDPNTQWTITQPKFFASSKVDDFLEPIDTEGEKPRKRFRQLSIF